MLAEWSAECGADDPVLVVPWSAPEAGMEWVDLRENPDALDLIPEADAHPAMLEALRVLNGARSPVFTAKCDVWTMDEDDLDAVRAGLLLEEDVAAAGIASYIDLLWRDRAVFLSRHQMEGMMHRLERVAAPLPHSLAALECVLRPAVLDLGGAVREGFAVTLYVKGCGVDTAEAEERWSRALRDVCAQLRRTDAFSV